MELSDGAWYQAVPAERVYLPVDRLSSALEGYIWPVRQGFSKASVAYMACGTELFLFRGGQWYPDSK